jgi:hypothetical protein
VTNLFSYPTAAQLLHAVAEWLEDPAPSAYERRVAVHVLHIVDREIVRGAELEAEERSRLAAVGYADRESLARAIRSGQEPRYQQIKDYCIASAMAELGVNNPRYLDSAYLGENPA